MTAILEVDRLVKNYGAIRVLKDVTLSVAEAETLAIIGPNGAGKTTLFKTLTGEVRANAGAIRAFGRDVTRATAAERVALGFGRTFQVARIFPEMTLEENVLVALESRRRMRGERVLPGPGTRPDPALVEDAGRWLDGVGLADQRRDEARHLSHGDKKRLELAIALSLEPRILMMDEPTAGMAPADRHATVALVRRIRERHNVTLLLTEHDMDVVFGLSDRIMVLNYGEIIAIGTGEEIRADPAVREVYLGHEGQEEAHA